MTAYGQEGEGGGLIGVDTEMPAPTEHCRDVRGHSVSPDLVWAFYPSSYLHWPLLHWADSEGGVVTATSPPEAQLPPYSGTPRLSGAGR